MDEDQQMAQLQTEVERLRSRIRELEASEAACSQAQQALHASELLHRALFENANDAIFLLQGQKVVDCNGKAQELFGLRRHELLGRTPQELSPALQPDGLEAGGLVRSRIAEALEGGAPCFEWTHQRPDGSLFETEICLSRVDLPQGPLVQAIARDISARKEVERALRESEERYRIVADYTFDWEMWLSPGGEMRYVSPSCQRVSGRPAAFFLEGGTEAVRSCLHEEDLGSWDEYMAGLMIEGQEGDIPAAGDGEGPEALPPMADFRLRHPSGEERWVCQVCRKVAGADGGFLGLRVSLRDITQRKRMEQQLRHDSLHDPLTGLANRTLCLDRIARVLERSKRRYNYHYAVLVIELDRFAQINESLGHRFGDMLLVQAAARISRVVRSIDTVSRFGGENFVVILDEMDSPREAVKVAKRIRDAMRAPFPLNGHEAQTGVSVGMVMSPAVYRQPEDLLQNASIAMRHAQKSGRNRFKVFTGRLLEDALRVLALESDLRRALDAGEFRLVFQPIVSLRDQKLAGFEALVRWLHPTQGAVPPACFIPIAEECGLIVELGYWVLDEACRTLACWRREGALEEGMTVAVNLSPRQLSQSDLVDRVREIMLRHEVPPRQLKLEITETTIMENADSAAEKLARLRQLGIQLSIDDFGTGYSSMNQLSRFPLDNLKIDLSFVQQMHSAPENLEIVRAIISLAHNLGLDVVAEGIELPDQHGELQSLECEFGQGYLFSKPMPPEQALEFLRLRSASGKAVA